MSTPFLGSIMLVSFNFPPKGWALCDGQLMPINQNQALFSLLGTTYGGNGETTFALPNLQGRVPIHQGAGFSAGQSGGEEAHALSLGELAAHEHTAAVAASNDAETTNRPGGSYYSEGGVFGSSPIVPMGGTATSALGGSQPHENRQPSLALVFVIALQGIFPSRN